MSCAILLPVTRISCFTRPACARGCQEHVLDQAATHTESVREIGVEQYFRRLARSLTSDFRFLMSQVIRNVDYHRVRPVEEGAFEALRELVMEEAVPEGASDEFG